MSSSVLTATGRERAEPSLAAFEHFVRIHHVTVFRLTVCLLGDRVAAEEVTEQVFVELSRRHDREPSTATLLLGSVERCLDRAAPTPLLKALRRIEGADRTGWLLHDVLRFPTARVAELLTQSEPESLTRLHRTRLALSSRLAP
ncbi:hypothetical protein [Amycolatopsis sp. Hca4]|uniref:hypothetical protein n=1 Tax=Amycolatopsis sp. Hca4 TaxID=2742131 RepID=UPI001591F830|nr:hypothetical protein [Amycolatopsis sp. Hca4]QKV73824.1 hypothetical protein HUT10_08600 [Amycolatopsis sp. Hca4]